MAIAKKTDEVRINRQIRATKVRLISAEGEQVGIVSLQEALQVAGDEGLDLVEVAPNSDPPVCRVMDYGKFKYQASKKVQEARKKSRASQMKEIKLGLKGYKWLDEGIELANELGLDVKDHEIIRTNSSGLIIYNPKNLAERIKGMKNTEKTREQKIAERVAYMQQQQTNSDNLN